MAHRDPDANHDSDIYRHGSRSRFSSVVKLVIFHVFTQTVHSCSSIYLGSSSKRLRSMDAAHGTNRLKHPHPRSTVVGVGLYHGGCFVTCHHQSQWKSQSFVDGTDHHTLSGSYISTVLGFVTHLSQRSTARTFQPLGQGRLLWTFIGRVSSELCALTCSRFLAELAS